MTMMRVLQRARPRWDLDAYLLFRSTLRTNLEEPEVGRFVIRELAGPEDALLAGTCRLSASAHEPSAQADGSARDDLAAKLRKGDRCFVTISGDEVVGARWVAGPRSKVYDGFGAFVRDVPDSCLFNQAYVRPDSRGYGLQMLMDAYMKWRLAREGIRVAFVCVGVRNIASILNCHRCNDEYRLLYHLQIELPGFQKRHYYPKKKKEPWRPCVPGRAADAATPQIGG